MNGIEMIAAERQRQVEVEGFDASHDADAYHDMQQLAWCACYYAMPSELSLFEGGIMIDVHPVAMFPYSWDSRWAKRDGKSRIRQLVVAGALIAAEIDRLQVEV